MNRVARPFLLSTQRTSLFTQFSKHHRTFSTATSNNETTSEFLKGEVLDLAVDIKSLHPGDRISIPYEITISESFQDFWHSAFHAQDRINTSTPFARKIRLQDRVLPFSLMLFLTSAMTHADAAKIQVGLDNAIYHWPAFAGDTVTKSYQVQSIRNTSDGNHSIINFTCELQNQRQKLIFSTSRRTMFPFHIPSSSLTPPTNPQTKSQLFRDHLLNEHATLHKLGSHSLIKLHKNQCIFHTMNRSLTLSQSQQLSSLARITHERHFDTNKYDPKTELLIPGGLVLGLALSASSKDLHEILHEEIHQVSFANSVHPGDVVGAISYVKSVEENLYGDLERLVVRTVGVKNVNVVNDLEGVELPLELFEGTKIGTTKEIERVCKQKCPVLGNKIVVVVEREIVRQASRREVFLL